MSTTTEWADIALTAGAIIATGAFTLLLKSLLYKYRRPNGKKGGIISFHVAVAFAIVTSIALVTKDWFLTGLSVILAYLIGRGRMDEGQHYLYQVTMGAIVGVLIPYGIFYIYHRRLELGSSSTVLDREDYDDKPRRAHDDRHEADDAPELRLDDAGELDFDEH